MVGWLLVGILGVLVGVLGVFVGLLGVLVGLLCILVGVLDLLFGVLGFYLAYLVFLFGVFGFLFGVFGVLAGVHAFYLAYLFLKKVHRLEKSTLPPVVAVVTNIRYAEDLFGLSAPHEPTAWVFSGFSRSRAILWMDGCIAWVGLEVSVWGDL